MKRKLGRFILIAGLILVLSSAVAAAYNAWDENRAAEIAARTSQLLIRKLDVKPDEEDVGVYTDIASVSTPPLIEIDGEFYTGILSIPSLSLTLPINDQCSDENLKDSSCRYSGSLSGPMVICAHNYKTHFGGISRLSEGDAVLIIDANGEEHSYVAVLTTELDGSDVEGMVNNPYDLTLFTCNPRNNTKRITVRCRKVPPMDSEPLIAEIADSEPGEPEPELPVEEVVPDNAPDAPYFLIDYNKETLKIRKGYLYSTDDAVSYTEVAEEDGVILDVSDCITYGISIYIKKAATDTRPESRRQVITPVARDVLESSMPEPVNGKITLGNRYEVYNTSTGKWGRLPRISADAQLDIRLKSTARTLESGVTGNAASLPGKLIIKYGEYQPGKTGITGAEIVPPAS